MDKWIRFEKTYLSLTELLKIIPKNNWFKEATKETIKKIRFSIKKDLKFKPQINPSLFGTFGDNYIAYKINKREYFNNCRKSWGWFGVFSHLYKNNKDTYNKIWQKMQDESINLNWKDFINITKSIVYYRSGVIVENINEQAFIEDAKRFDVLVTKQIKKYIKTKNIVINPVFGSWESGIAADGDLIMDNKLVEIKCSRNQSLKVEYLRQLIGYFALNKCLEYFKQNYYNIHNTFIYWNPFYDIFYEFNIEENELQEYSKKFNSLRELYVNKTKKRKDQK